MPKMTQVYGLPRTTLMYALIAYLSNQPENESSLEELADHFGYSEKEIESAVRSIAVTDVGGHRNNYLGALYDLDYDLLESEKIVRLYGLENSLLKLPRLTSRQAATLVAALKRLILIPQFELKDDAEELLRQLAGEANAASSNMVALPPTSVDADLLTVREAILTGKAISCDYINGAGETSKDRVIDPLRLESQDLVWYLRGWCHNRKEVRVFKLDAMDKTRILEQEIPAERREIKLTGGLFEPGKDSIDVLIAVEPEAYEVLSDYRAKYKDKPTGTFQATIKVGSLATLGPMVASYGGAVKVLAPAEAVARVREYALSALGRTDEATAERDEQLGA
jgi:proteasome accessory factor C